MNEIKVNIRIWGWNNNAKTLKRKV